MCDKIEVDGRKYSVARIHKKLWAVLIDGQPSRYQLKLRKGHKKGTYWAIVEAETGCVAISLQAFHSRGAAFVTAIQAL